MLVAKLGTLIVCLDTTKPCLFGVAGAKRTKLLREVDAPWSSKLSLCRGSSGDVKVQVSTYAE